MEPNVSACVSLKVIGSNMTVKHINTNKYTLRYFLNFKNPKVIIPEVLQVESRHIWWSPKWSIPPPFTPPSSLEPPSSTPQSFFAEGAIWNNIRKRVVSTRGQWTHFQTRRVLTRNSQELAPPRATKDTNANDRINYTNQLQRLA